MGAANFLGMLITLFISNASIDDVTQPLQRRIEIEKLQTCKADLRRNLFNTYHASYAFLEKSYIGFTPSAITINNETHELVFLAHAHIPVPLSIYTWGRNPLCGDSGHHTLTLLPGFFVKLRMLRGRSNQVIAPSYEPTPFRIQYLYEKRTSPIPQDQKVKFLAPVIAPGRSHLFGLTLTLWEHHSNGREIDSPFKDCVSDCTVKDIDQFDGGFSTNFTGIKLNYQYSSIFNNVPGDYQPYRSYAFGWEYQYHHDFIFPGKLTEDLKPFWNQSRHIFDFEFRQRRPNSNAYFTVGAKMEMYCKYLSCFGNNAIDYFSSFEIAYFPSEENMPGIYVRGRYGQDPYNILFTSQLCMLDIGVTLDTSRSLFKFPALLK